MIDFSEMLLLDGLVRLVFTFSLYLSKFYPIPVTVLGDTGNYYSLFCQDTREQFLIISEICAHNKNVSAEEAFTSAVLTK